MLCLLPCVSLCVFACSALADLFDSLTLRDEVDVQSAQTASEATDRESSQQKMSEQKALTAAEGSPACQPPVLRQSVAGVRSPLFPHQVAGVHWMIRRESGASADGTSPLGGIVADDPGLGNRQLLDTALLLHQLSI